MGAIAGWNTASVYQQVIAHIEPHDRWQLDICTLAHHASAPVVMKQAELLAAVVSHEAA